VSPWAVWDDDATDVEEGSPRENPNFGSAVSEAELRAYYARRRPMIVWSLALVLPAALIIARVSPVAAVALLAGAVCGLLNALLSMRSNERLLDHRSVGSFVISSVLRILVFGIVPVGFCLHGPWWSMATYFIGFFTPLACYATIVARFIRTDS
jgi:hypothetical protein